MVREDISAKLRMMLEHNSEYSSLPVTLIILSSNCVSPLVHSLIDRLLESYGPGIGSSCH
jgi:hypothetical protein